MRKDCDTCLHDEFGETYCNDCYWANGKPPTKWEPALFWAPDTNADRIRAMSDEELRDFLQSKVWLCETHKLCDTCTMYDDERGCLSLKEWLKQPAEPPKEE